MALTNSQEPIRIRLSRTRVGLITLGCFVCGGLIRFGAAPTEQNDMWVAGFMRAGIVMGALWICLPTSKRPAAWANVSLTTLGGLVLALLLFARNPRMLLNTLPAFAALAALNFFLRPRPGARDQRPDRSSWK